MAHYIFKPTDRNMLREYPELSEYKEFVDLKNDDLVFIWHYIFDRSDLDKLSEKEWKVRAAKKAFDTDKTKIAEYSTLELPPHLRPAIERMKTFSLSARMRAKAMIDRLFADFETINKKIIIDLTDMDDQKKLMDMKMSMAKSLPDLIQQYERGYGVSEEETKVKTERTKSYADDIHAHLDRNKHS